MSQNQALLWNERHVPEMQTRCGAADIHADIIVRSSSAGKRHRPCPPIPTEKSSKDRKATIKPFLSRF